MGLITLALAFSAGLASFLSPCVLPLIPAYIGYLGGKSTNNFGKDKYFTFINGLAFIFGFSVVFILFGIAVSVIGGYLNIIRNFSEKIGGLIVILVGLNFLNIIKIPELNYDKRIYIKTNIYLPIVSSFFMGVFFSAGWSPCIGPILGSILMIALNQGDLVTGLIMLSVYSLGLAVPFLIISFSLDSGLRLLNKFHIFSKYIEIVSGIVMIIIGIMLFFGLFQQIATIGTLINL